MSSESGAQQTLGGDWINNGRRANLSELSRSSGLDRATVKKRLEAAGIAPVRDKIREKQFDVNQATAALGAPREADGYQKARQQKTTAETARILLKLQRERGELAPVSELREQAYLLIKGLHLRFSRYARDARGRLFKAQSVTELERTLAQDIASIFQEIKRDGFGLGDESVRKPKRPVV